MYSYFGTYRLADSEKIDETSVYYLNELLGLAIQHDDLANITMMPFLYMPNNSSIDQNTISYTLLWANHDINENQLITRNYLPNVSEQQFRSGRLSQWFKVPFDFFTKEY